MERMSADALMRELAETHDLAACLRSHEGQFLRETVAQGLASLYKTRAISKAELARRSGISLVYLHQVFAGRRTPSRDRLVGICLGLEASLDECQHLLRLGMCAPLCPLNRRDAVLIYCVVHRTPLKEAGTLLLQAQELPLY